MKKALLILTLILLSGGWIINQYVTRASNSSAEKERFIEYASNYKYSTETFLTEQAKQHHDEAFAASYRMWKLSPVSEIELSSHFNEKTYYLTLGKIIKEASQKEGQVDAYKALLDIGSRYGVVTEKTSSKQTPLSSSPAATPPPKTSDTPLGKSKLGDKRTIPSRRNRDQNR